MTWLITSQAYQPFWRSRFQMTKTGERRLENDQAGFKIATSVGGVSTGERGDRVLLDDPDNVRQVGGTLNPALRSFRSPNFGRTRRQ
jgi:hypothetical protein